MPKITNASNAMKKRIDEMLGQRNPVIYKVIAQFDKNGLPKSPASEKLAGIVVGAALADQQEGGTRVNPKSPEFKSYYQAAMNFIRSFNGNVEACVQRIRQIDHINDIMGGPIQEEAKAVFDTKKEAEVVSTKVSAPTAEVGAGTVITAKVNGLVKSGQKNETNEYKNRVDAILAEEDTKAVMDTDADTDVIHTSGTGPSEKAGTGKDTKPTIGSKLGKTGKAEH